MSHAIDVAMTALYLRGLGGSPLPRRHWPATLGALRAAGVCNHREAVSCLQDAGLTEEALRLGHPALWSTSQELVCCGRVLTVASPSYPSRWRWLLGVGAPPVLWASGPPLTATPLVAVVGSRDPSPAVVKAVISCVEDLAKLGFGVVSGGARGVDRIAENAALERAIPLVSLLPSLPAHAIFDSPGQASILSLHPRMYPVGTASLMERNALIYAAAEFAIVFGPRFKSGGTWHGAIEAHRRRLTKLLVLDEPDSLGSRALVALGAASYDPRKGIMASLSQDPIQSSLPLAEPW